MMGFAEAELNQLEEVVLSKIQQRVPSRLSEDNFIVKAFKYHDLGDSGAVDFMKFKRAMAPFTAGILDQDVRMIFDRYAPNGALPYKQFASEFVRGSRRRGGGRMGGPGSEMALGSEAGNQVWEGPEQCLMRMKGCLAGLGPRAIVALAMSFREVDPENSRTVDHNAFEHVLLQHFTTENGCPVQAGQLAQIFQLFMQPYSPGLLAYDEFLQALKDDPMSQDRRACVRLAFRRLDTTSEGMVDLNKLINSFNASRHPQVSEGGRKAEEVLEEFAETLQDSVAFRRGQRCYPSSLVAWEEFEDYYKFISASIDSDAMFCAILQRVFDLDKTPDQSVESREKLARPAAGIPGKSRAGLHHWQSDTLPTNLSRSQADQSGSINRVLEHARAVIARKGLRFAVDVVQNFFAADDDVDDFLDMYEFRRACQQSGIMLKESEEEACFRMCGEGNGRQQKINLQKFLRALHGPISPQRFALIEDAYIVLGGDPKSEDSEVNPSALKQNFCAEGHPLVVKGEMDPGVVLGEFLDTFSLLAHVLGGCQTGAVTFPDFLAYYDLVSSTIDSDALFELLMSRLWLGQDEPESVADPASPVRGPAASQGGGSPSKRWAVPVEALDNPLARQRPPAFVGGVGAYARGSDMEPGGVQDAHRRFAKGPMASSMDAPITKSQIVFNETETGELGGVVKRLRSSLARRGLKGWKLLGERFLQHDHRGNGSVMRLDWQRLHRSLGLGLSPEEQEIVFKGFSVTRRDGAMDYRECMRSLRGPLNERRATLVHRLFDVLSEQGPGVSTEKLKASFDAKNAPLCLVGTKDAASERQEFFEGADFFGVQGGFDAEGFAEFFSMISSTYREEDEFKLMMTAAFGLPSGGPFMGGC